MEERHAGQEQAQQVGREACWQYWAGAIEMVEQFEVEKGHAGQHQGQQVGGEVCQQCTAGANVVVEQ